MKINNHVGNVHIKFDTKRIDGNLKEAQTKLNMQIVHPNSKERSMELRRFASFLQSDSESFGAAAAI